MPRFLIILLVASVSFAARAERLFAEITTMPKVESLYMSSEVLSNVQPQSMSPRSNFVKRFDLMETLTIGKNDTARNKSRSIITSLELTLLLETRDNEEGESSHIYIRKPEAGSQTTDIVIIVTEDPDEMEIIHIEGEINVAELISRYSRFASMIP